MEKSIQKFISVLILLGVANVANSATTLIKPGTEFTVGNRDLPDPLTPLNHLIDPSVVAKSPIKETEGCKDIQVWESVIVPENHWLSVASPIRRIVRQMGVLAIAAQSNCVRVGYPMRVASIDAATGFGILQGWFMPTSIAPRRPVFQKQEDPILISAGLFNTDKPVVLVTGRVILNAGMTSLGPYSPRMVGVRMINRDQMESAIRDKTTIIDVRPKKQFDLAHVRGAIHIPYTTGPRMTILDPYGNYAKSGDAFDIRRVKADRQQPVVLMGEGPESDGVYRAAVVLRSEGWKNILIFYEGFNYFSGMIWSPPALSNMVGVISEASQLATLMADRTLAVRILDARSVAEFNESTVAGAFSVPLVERDDLRMRRRGLNGQMLTSYGDLWNPPSNLAKTTPIVIMGSTGLDWRGYKAALIAKSMGFVTVYWFRRGVESWQMASSLNPEKFPVSRGASASTGEK